MAKTKAQQQPPYTSDDLDHAHRAALDITQQSPVVQGCITALIFSRQLFDATRALLEAEIRDGWEVPHPELVIHTLMAAAHNKGVQLVSAQALHKTCIETILPFVDSLLQLQLAAERGNGVSATQGTENVESRDIPAAAAAADRAAPVDAAAE